MSGVEAPSRQGEETEERQMDFNSIVFERYDEIAVITLNRPNTLNVLNADLRREMHAAIDDVTNDDSIRALILTGSGRGFSSGADLSGAPGADSLPPQNDRLDELQWMGRQALAVYGLNKPTIAAMNGVAAGAGMSLALACTGRLREIQIQDGLPRAGQLNRRRHEFLPEIP